MWFSLLRFSGNQLWPTGQKSDGSLSEDMMIKWASEIDSAVFPPLQVDVDGNNERFKKLTQL